MARGILVIASDTLGNQTIINHRENGLLYKKNDPIALKNILEEVLNYQLENPAILTKIAYKGLNFAKNHTVYHVHEKRDILLKKELHI